MLNVLQFSDILICWQWIPELQHYAPGVPVVLVETKLGKWATTSLAFSVKFNVNLVPHIIIVE